MKKVRAVCVMCFGVWELSYCRETSFFVCIYNMDEKMRKKKVRGGRCIVYRPTANAMHLPPHRRLRSPACLARGRGREATREGGTDTHPTKERKRTAEGGNGS